jgi:hypothetical protein
MKGEDPVYQEDLREDMKTAPPTSSWMIVCLLAGICGLASVGEDQMG